LVTSKELWQLSWNILKRSGLDASEFLKEELELGGGEGGGLGMTFCELGRLYLLIGLLCCG
jgi:hypothetical protein